MSENLISASSLKKTKNSKKNESRKQKSEGKSLTFFDDKSKTENNNRVFTVNTEIRSSLLKSEEIDFLDSYLKEYNHVKFKYTALLQKGRILPDYKVSEIKNLCDENNQLPYRIFNAGVMQSVNSQVKSQISNKKNYLENTLEDIKDCLKKLEKSRNYIKLFFSHSSLYRNNPENQTRLHKAKRNIASYTRRLDKLNTKKEKLEREINNNTAKFCYGSAYLLRKRNQIHKNDKVKITFWRKEWNLQRYGQMLFTGSTDEVSGNSNAHIYLDENNQFILRITVPTGMKHIYSFTHLEVPVKISYYQEELREHIYYHSFIKPQEKVLFKNKNKNEPDTEFLSENLKGSGAEEKQEKKTSSLSVRLMKNAKGNYSVALGLNTSVNLKPEVITDDKNGVIGVDINPDHLDIAETDSKGNYIKGWSVPLDLKDKSSAQRKTIICQAVADITDYAVKNKKDVITENLDFSKKKKQLKDNYNKHYARMLSAFAYGKIKESFTTNCWRKGIKLTDVNPAYTSFIGKIKYAKYSGYNLNGSNHTSAAFVIARRGMKCKEIIPKHITIIKKTIKSKTDETELKDNQKESELTVGHVSLGKMIYVHGKTNFTMLSKLSKQITDKKIRFRILDKGEACAETLKSNELRSVIEDGSPIPMTIFIPFLIKDQV